MLLKDRLGNRSIFSELQNQMLGICEEALKNSEVLDIADCRFVPETANALRCFFSANREFQVQDSQNAVRNKFLQEWYQLYKGEKTPLPVPETWTMPDIIKTIKSLSTDCVYDNILAGNNRYSPILTDNYRLLCMQYRPDVKFVGFFLGNILSLVSEISEPHLIKRCKTDNKFSITFNVEDCVIDLDVIYGKIYIPTYGILSLSEAFNCGYTIIPSEFSKVKPRDDAWWKEVADKITQHAYNNILKECEDNLGTTLEDVLEVT